MNMIYIFVILTLKYDRNSILQYKVEIARLPPLLIITLQDVTDEYLLIK